MLHSCRAKTSYLYTSPSLRLFVGFYKRLTDEQHFKQLVTEPLFVCNVRVSYVRLTDIDIHFVVYIQKHHFICFGLIQPVLGQISAHLLDISFQPCFENI